MSACILAMLAVADGLHAQFVNVPELARKATDDEILHSLDALKEQQAQAVRAMLVTPIGRTLNALEAARSRKLGCLLLFTVTLGPLYPPDTHRRQGRPPNIYTLPPFSQVDP